MNEIISCIESLRTKLDRYRKDGLKESPTRTIFVDPLLQALGWDVRDSDEVELEYPTIDRKSVDYAPKINRKPVLFIEAKQLNDPLTDVKSITQVVGYAANAGVEWCILTNGVTYKVYHSTEKAEAPEKLLFKISLDPKETEGMTTQQVAEQFAHFSRDAMAKGLLDEIGEQTFTTGKIRKALGELFRTPPNTLIKLIRSTIRDDSIKPMQVKKSLKRLWSQTSEITVPSTYKDDVQPVPPERTKVRDEQFSEEYDLGSMPQRVVELFWTFDQFCIELDPTAVQRMYLVGDINYIYGKNIFCCVDLNKSGIRVWLRLNYSDLESQPEYVQEWDTGIVELKINSIQKFESAKGLLQKSFEENRLK